VNWSFKDKVALVTGSAAGMGLATARAFADAGAAVALADSWRLVPWSTCQSVTIAATSASSATLQRMAIAL
jgi:NAD(P)-dependent dehydrogenase (short-subunit alcohol dehydrogenase family)